MIIKNKNKGGITGNEINKTKLYLIYQSALNEYLHYRIQ